jgi:hypothetical protein
MKTIFVLATLAFSFSNAFAEEAEIPASEAATTFYAYQVSGVGLVDKFGEDIWHSPTQVGVALNVCLKSRVTGSPVIGEDFSITGNGEHKGWGTAGRAGCMTWDEHLPFKYLSKKVKTVKLVRQIQGTGKFQGSITVQFAVNPWVMGREGILRESVDGVRGVTAASVPIETISEEKYYESLRDVNDRPDISLGGAIDVRGTLLGGTRDVLTLRMATKPVIESHDSNGMLVHKELRDGEFQLATSLVVTEDANKKSLVTEERLTSAAVINGEIRTRLYVAVPSSALSATKLSLVLRLTPRRFDGEAPVNDFAALCELGPVGAGEITKCVITKTCSVNSESGKCGVSELLR